MYADDFPDSPEAAAELHRLLNGFQVTQAIHVAAVLGVADHIATDPMPVAALGQAVDAHPDALYRLLRALAAIGIFREHDGRRFSLTPMGACLRTDSAHPVRPHAIFTGQRNQWDAWGALLHSVRTGDNAFRAVHGIGSWEYRARHPEQNAIFNAAMTANSRRIERAIVEAYDFGRHARIVDVGGGQGSLLSTVLRTHNDLRGVLFDQPHVVASAGAALAAAGIAERCTAVGGDMFVAIPEGCDAAVLKYIVHDWDDAHCTRILQSCRTALPRDGRLIVIERLLGPPNEDPAVKFADLHMLVGPGGQERTLDELAALFGAAGWRVAEVRGTTAPVSLIVLERT